MTMVALGTNWIRSAVAPLSTKIIIGLAAALALSAWINLRQYASAAAADAEWEAKILAANAEAVEQAQEQWKAEQAAADTAAAADRQSLDAVLAQASSTFEPLARRLERSARERTPVPAGCPEHRTSAESVSVLNSALDAAREASARRSAMQ